MVISGVLSGVPTIVGSAVGGGESIGVVVCSIVGIGDAGAFVGMRVTGAAVGVCVMMLLAVRAKK